MDLSAWTPNSQLLIFLVNLVLQVTLVAGAGRLAVTLLRRRSVPLQYEIQLIVLLFLFLAPLTTWAAGHLLAQQTTLPRLALSPQLVTLTEAVPAGKESLRQMPATGAASGLAEELLKQKRSAEKTVGKQPAPALNWRGVATLLILGGWIAGSCYQLVLCSRSQWLIWRIRRTWRPLNDLRYRAATADAATQLGLRKPPRLRCSPLVCAPLILGLVRPTIVIPPALEDTPSDAAVEGIVLHESAHAARKDLWVGLVQDFLSIVYWWHPLLQRLEQEMIYLREVLCDRYVHHQQGDGSAFARCLLDIAQKAGPGPRPHTAPNLAQPHYSFEQRVTLLLQRENAMMKTKLSPLMARFTDLCTFLALCAVVPLAIGLATPPAQAAPLSGTINLSDLGTTVAGIRYDGQTGAGEAGVSVSGAGDVNGDGFADFLIGAQRGNGNTGQAYLVYGSASLTSGALSLNGIGSSIGSAGFNGIASSDLAGHAVSGAGDFNGDGRTDLLIGAFGEPTGTFTGAAYLIYGQPGAATLDQTRSLSTVPGTTAGFRFSAISGGDQNGRSLSNAGDVNGDGIDDILISSIGAAPNGSFSGQTYLVYGRSGASTLLGQSDMSIADATFNGLAANNLAGLSVSGGDFNGDGLSDILIGAPGPLNGAGQTYLIYGRSGASALSGTTNLSSADVIFNGVNAGDESGSFLSNAGDINGDGIDDFLIGAQNADPNGASSGQSYLIYGQSGASALSGTISLSTADVTFNGIAVNDQSGVVSAAGDINGDGIGDLLIGASQQNNGGTGQTYLVYGRSGASALSGAFDLSTADVTFNGINSGDVANGISVSNAGDVNGDGIDDLLIGEMSALSGSGQVFLVFGQAETVPEPGTIFLVGLGLIGIARGVRRRQAGAEKAKK